MVGTKWNMYKNSVIRKFLVNESNHFFKLNAQVLNYECKCVHVHNLDLKLSTLILFIETTLIGREFHILMTDGKNEYW